MFHSKPYKANEEMKPYDYSVKSVKAIAIVKISKCAAQNIFIHSKYMLKDQQLKKNKSESIANIKLLYMSISLQISICDIFNNITNTQIVMDFK